MRIMLLLCLVPLGCTTPAGSGLADLLGGVSAETVEPTCDGRHVVVSTRFGDGPVRPLRWYLVRLADRRTIDLTGPETVARWTDAEVWPSPVTDELAIVSGDEVRIFSVPLEQDVERLDRRRQATRTASAFRDGRTETLAHLTTPHDPGERRRRFWREYLSARNDPAATGPLTAEMPSVERHPAPPAIYHGDVTDRYGEASGLTTVTAAPAPGEPPEVVLESHRSQFYRQAVRWPLLPVGLLTWTWQRLTDATVSGPVRWAAGSR